MHGLSPQYIAGRIKLLLYKQRSSQNVKITVWVAIITTLLL